MSTNIPTRRTTRVARTIQSDENKLAKTTTSVVRLTRTKPPSAQSSTSNTSNPKSVLGDGVDGAGKRKREALGEVTNGKGQKTSLAAKKGVDLKDSKAGAATTASKVVVTRKTRSTQIKERVTSQSVRRTVDESDDLDGTVASASTSVPIAQPTRRALKKPYVYISTLPPGTVQDEIEPANKKRRTSPEQPDENEKELEPATKRLPLQVIEEEAAVEVVEVVKEGENVEGWDDLDKDDDDDPSMCSEYVQEIFNYFKTLEVSTLPDPIYMERQKELTWNMRGILVDYLVQMHNRFRLQQESLFLAINILDRFLSLREVSLAKFQLVGCVALFIAAKAEDTIAPAAGNLVHQSEKAFTEAEIFNAEKYILKTIDWNLSYPSPLNFLRRASKADNYDIQTRTVGKYLIEIGAVEWRLVACLPSLLAGASMWLARLILDQHEWTPNLEHYSSYSERALLPTANLIVNYILKPIKHEQFYKKYATKKYMKVSVYCRTWALERWNEGDRVDLTQDLERLKQIAQTRSAERMAADAD